MEMLLVFLGVFVFFFVLGIVFVLRGSPAREPAFDETAAKELALVRDELQATRQEDQQLKVQLDTLAMEFQQAQEKIQAAQSLDDEAERLRQGDSEKQRVISFLERNLQFLKQKADEQARAAMEVMELLQGRIQALPSKSDEEDFQRVKEDNRQVQQQLSDLLLKVREFESQFAAMESLHQGRVTQAESAAQQYLEECGRLKQGLRQIMLRITEADRELAALKDAHDETARQWATEKAAEEACSREEIARLKNELRVLQASIKDNNAVMAELEEQLKQEREQLSHARAKIENFKAAPPLEEAAAGHVSSGEVLRLQQEKEQVSAEKARLEERLEEMRRKNAFMAQKEQLLQSELIRSQTEALGLKRICDGFRQRLERAAA